MSDDDKQIKELLDKSKSTYILISSTEFGVTIMKSDVLERVAFIMVESMINDLEFDVLCQFVENARGVAKKILTLKKYEKLSSLRSEEE